MGLDDLVSTESAVVATATAAIFSPRTRETLRRGAVLGVAGALKAGDIVYGAARGVVSGVRDVAPGTSSPSGSSRSSGNGSRSSARSASARSRRSGAARSASSRTSARRSGTAGDSD